jgi:hypothetical protein
MLNKFIKKRNTHTRAHTHAHMGIAVNISAKDWVEILCQDATWNIWRLILTELYLKI